jgi:CheY-specific phosphatase CheX
MSGINSLELKDFITNAVSNVFDTMLSMEVESVEAGQTENYNGGHIASTVGFAGKVLGNLNLHVGEEFAIQMTAAMLGMETDELDGDEEVHDVIGEVCNMIAGDLKSRLCDSGFTCELSIPSITTGKEFKIVSQGWDRSERFGFSSNQHTARVDVFMKTGN